MKNQNKDREEFDKIINNASINFDETLGEETVEELWKWIETHTKKKVEEAKTELLEENKKIVETWFENHKSECNEKLVKWSVLNLLDDMFGRDFINLLNKKDESIR